MPEAIHITLRTVCLGGFVLAVCLGAGCKEKTAREKIIDAAESSQSSAGLPTEQVEAAKAAPPPVKPIPPPPAEPISGDTRSEFPELARLVEDQLAAMNTGSTDAFLAFLAPDAPRSVVLIEEFRGLSSEGNVYELYGFEAKRESDDWVKGPVVMMAKAPEGTAIRITYNYTFKRGADKSWKVFDMMATGAEKLGK
ncbi:MAG: hypothetical protein M3R04_02250 [bacterium]|nr:hypothetical protein [bacterium]